MVLCRSELKKEACIFTAFGTILFLSEIWKQLVLTLKIYNGKYCFSFLPFQLCSIAMYLSLFLGLYEFLQLRKQSTERFPSIRDSILGFLSDYSLLGACASFLDTSGMHYETPTLTVHSFSWHILLIVIGIYAGTRRRRTDRMVFLRATAVYLMCCVFAEVLNLSLDRYGVVNMFYINPHYYMVQIVYSDLIPFFTNNGVIIIYILSIAAAAFVLHLLWNRTGRVGRRGHR